MKRSFQRFLTRLDSLDLDFKHELEYRARMNYVSLRELYDGPNAAPSIRSARRSVYQWLMRKKGKGVNEVARLFDRAPSGVSRLTR